MTIERIDAGGTKLFDGDDSIFYQFHYTFPTPNITVYERDFRNNYFENLQRLMSPLAFAQLLREGNFKSPKGPFGDFTGTDSLTLNYFMSGKYLFIFASGEYQPTRYKIYLEGIWLVKQTA